MMFFSVAISCMQYEETSEYDNVITESSDEIKVFPQGDVSTRISEMNSFEGQDLVHVYSESYNETVGIWNKYEISPKNETPAKINLYSAVNHFIVIVKKC